MTDRTRSVPGPRGGDPGAGESGGGVTVRAARAADRAGVRSLLADLPLGDGVESRYRDVPGFDPWLGRMVRGVRRSFVTMVCWVAVDGGGEVVGVLVAVTPQGMIDSLSLGWARKAALAERVIELGPLVVREDRRGSRLGYRLVGHACAELGSGGFRLALGMVEPPNVGLLGYYRGCGFSVVPAGGSLMVADPGSGRVLGFPAGVDRMVWCSLSAGVRVGECAGVSGVVRGVL